MSTCWRNLAVCFPEVRECLEEADRLLADSIPGGVTSYMFPPSRFTEQETARCRRGSESDGNHTAGDGRGVHGDVAVAGIPGPARGRGGRPQLRRIRRAGCGRRIFHGVALCFVRGARQMPRGGLRSRDHAGRVGTGGTRYGHRSHIEGVWIANVNSPVQTVLSGTQEGITQARERFTQLGIEARPVPVSCAFHSPLVARPKERLAAQLAATRFSPPRLPVFSNTTGELYPQGPAASAALLSEHLTRPVRFMDEVEAMYRAGVRTFVEVGPRRVLTGLVDQILAGRPHVAVASCGERSSLTECLQALAQLVVKGIPISLDRLYEGRAGGRVEARQAEIPSGVWLVNGGRARRLGEPAMRPAAAAPVFANAPTPVAKSPSPPVTATVLLSEADAVMVRFQETMTRFLETQRQTMMAYLGAANVSGGKPVLAQAPAANVPEVVVVTAPDVAEPVVATVSAAPAVTSIFDKLRGIISDRTGYPIEMLDPTLNLEADLGIDSIKRAEILGAFQRSCGDGIGLHDAMEGLTALKTIGSLAESLGDVLGTAAPPAVTKPVEQLPRFMLNAVIAPAPVRGSIMLPTGAVLITEDGRGIASRLARELTALGWPAMVLERPSIQKLRKAWLRSFGRSTEVSRVFCTFSPWLTGRTFLATATCA